MHLHSQELVKELEGKAKRLRSEIIKMIYTAGSGHPDMRKTPEINMSTGSLGNGLSIGIGMALSARLSKRDYHVYVFTQLQ